MRTLLVVLLALAIPSLTACPWGGNSTQCTSAVETAMRSASGRATQTDAGTLVALTWPSPQTPSPLGLDYFQQAQISAGVVRASRFSVVSTSEAQAQFAPLGGAFAFTVTFPEPDRLGLGGCTGQHGGMNDEVLLEVAVSAAADAGTRDVSTSAKISLGAF